MQSSLFSRIAVITGICLMPFAAYAGNYTIWNSADYDFTAVKSIYVDTLDTSALSIDGTIKAYQLKERFKKKAAAIKELAVTSPSLPAPAIPAVPVESVEAEKTADPSQKDEKSAPQTVEMKHVVTSDPGAAVVVDETDEDSEEIIESTPAKEETPPLPGPTMSVQTPEAVTIPAEAANADLYVTARVLAYTVGTGLIPAHTEWNWYTIRDVFYDHRGRPHWYYRDISYPVYVPDTYVPMATVGIRFTVYDVKTGQPVSCSEDIRTRGSSSDVKGVSNRIMDRFFKNLKKECKV